MSLLGPINVIEDVEKKRWKYLLVRAWTYVVWCGGVFLTVAFAILTIICFACIYNSVSSHNLINTGISIFCAIVAAFFSFAGICNLREANELEKRTAYVPPV